MTFSQKRIWGYNEQGNWDSVQGTSLPDNWTHENPSDPTTAEVVADEPAADETGTDEAE